MLPIYVRACWGFLQEYPQGTQISNNIGVVLNRKDTANDFKIQWLEYEPTL